VGGGGLLRGGALGGRQRQRGQVADMAHAGPDFGLPGGVGGWLFEIDGH